MSGTRLNFRLSICYIIKMCVFTTKLPIGDWNVKHFHFRGEISVIHIHMTQVQPVGVDILTSCSFAG
jgi:hypothetical protein